MKSFYIKQKAFSFTSKFTIYDEDEQPVLGGNGEVFSIGKKIHLYRDDLAGQTPERKAGYAPEDLVFIEQKVLSFMPTYFIHDNTTGRTVTVKKQLTLFKPSYEIPELGWQVDGDFMAHDYVVHSGPTHLAQVSKEWFTLGDAYRINVVNDSDSLMVLAIILVIDAVLDSQNSSAGAAAASSS